MLNSSQKYISNLADEIIALRSFDRRLIIGIAGPPASGKSTLADQLVTCLVTRGERACLVPMDGFHLDNRILEAQSLLPIKGAPQTFDFYGFEVLMKRICDRSTPIYYPTFNRSLDIAVAGSGVIQPDDDIIVVEGNYLLLDRDPWQSIYELFDQTIFIKTPMKTLRKRLIQRWINIGLT